jgi:hypothetical protein
LLAGGAARAGDLGYDRTFDLAANPVEVRLHYGDPAPGATALVGEGSIGTKLPGEGQLTVRIPHVVGPVATLGNAQVAASYDLVQEGPVVPKISVVALADLPTARGARGVQPGLKASAAKKVASRVIHAIHVETELRTNGPSLAPSYRTAIGTDFRLRAATTGSLDYVALRPAIGSGAAREDLAQLGFSQSLGPLTRLRLAFGGGVSSGAPSVRATLGLDLRF